MTNETNEPEANEPEPTMESTFDRFRQQDDARSTLVQRLPDPGDDIDWAGLDIREKALHLAVACRVSVEEETANVVARAEAFEQFLRGDVSLPASGPDQASVQGFQGSQRGINGGGIERLG